MFEVIFRMGGVIFQIGGVYIVKSGANFQSNGVIFHVDGIVFQVGGIIFQMGGVIFQMVGIILWNQESFFKLAELNLKGWLSRKMGVVIQKGITSLTKCMGSFKKWAEL